MRIPFVPKDVGLYKDRIEFIRQYRGGGFMLIGGSVYWFLAFIFSYILKDNFLINYYMFGGLAVPILGYFLFKLLRMQASPNQYSTLVGFASAITACCIPILLIIKNLNPSMILPVLCIINATHLLILCWVHLDYLYFILLALGECIGLAFIYSIPSEYTHYIGLVWGSISLLFGVIIHLTTKIPLKGYNYIILDK